MAPSGCCPRPEPASSLMRRSRRRSSATAAGSPPITSGAKRRRSSSRRFTSRRASSGFMPSPPYPQVRSRAHLAIAAEGVTPRKDLHASAALREALAHEFADALQLLDRGRLAGGETSGERLFAGAARTIRTIRTYFSITSTTIVFLSIHIV